jgi:oligopeptide transport system substrate-binding protein
MARLFAPLVCLFLIASCAPGAPTGGREPWKTDTELVTVLPSEPDVIDPQKVSFAHELSIVGMLYEPLLTWDAATLTLRPAAARSLPHASDDGREYTFTLREGLAYSDGTPLEAQRFVEAFVRACDPKVAGEYAFLAYAIAGCRELNVMDPKTAHAKALAAARDRVAVRAPDALTIQFTLREPDASFPQVTAMPLGSPVRLEDAGRWLDGYRTTRDPSVYVGNGPFIFKEWVRGERLVFERNERYRAPVRLARWTKRIVPDADTARVMYDAGRIDALAVTPRDAADREALLARPDMHRGLGPCTTYVGFNTARPPFDDQRVRLAFARALDKDNYVNSVAKTGRVAFSLVPHAQPGHAHDDRAQTLDSIEARQLLASSRYGVPVDGLLGGIPITFPFRQSLADRELAIWVADQLQRNLGVRVVPEVVNSWGHGLVKRIEAQPQLYRLAWCEDYPDGQDWYKALFHSQSAFSRTNFHEPRFDDFVTRADREQDAARRQSLYEEASRVLSREAPGAWLAWTEQWWLVRPELAGYELSSFDWDFAQLSLARIVGVKR